MKRIGLLGGTFNPVHIGHLVIAQMAQEKMKLDKVFFVPSFLPPHKSVSGILSARDRFNMVRLATSGNPAFAVSDIELKRKGRSFTIDTVEYFHERYPGAKLFFIIGSDWLPTLGSWERIDRILELVELVVVNRPGCSENHSKFQYRSIESPGIDISSSFLRQRIIRNQTIQYLVPEKVWSYIKKHRLFQQKRG